MEEKVRPAGVLKESPTETLLTVCNRLASIEIYNSQMKAPRRYQGTWPPECVVNEGKALEGIAAIVKLWQEGKV